MPGEERRQIEVGADRLEQGTFVERGLPRGAVLGAALLLGDIDVRRLFYCCGGAARGTSELRVLPVASIDQTLEVLAVADRPRDRRRAKLDLLLDLVEKFQRVAAGPVVLVEERDHRQVPRPAQLEQLQRLRLDAFGRVEHHYDGVDG